MRILKTVLLLFSVLVVFGQSSAELLIKANNATLNRKFDEALGYYQQYITLNPSDFRGYFNKGTTLYNAGRYDQAIMQFTKALSLNPIYKESVYFRGQSYVKKGSYNLAIQDFTSVLVVDTFNVPFLKQRAEAYQLNKQYQLAITDLSLALKQQPLSGDIYKRRAEVKVKAKDLKGALRDYSAVEKLIPAYKMVHYIKGNLFNQIDDEESACEEWQKALDAGVVVADKNYQDHCVVIPTEEN